MLRVSTSLKLELLKNNYYLEAYKHGCAYIKKEKKKKTHKAKNDSFSITPIDMTLHAACTVVTNDHTHMSTLCSPTVAYREDTNK